MSPELEVQRDGSVMRVTMNRQHRRNALSQGVMEQLVRLFDDLEHDDDVWAVLITGAGDVAFSSGRDLKELWERDTDRRHPFPPMRGTTRNVFETVHEFGKPVVAAINGWAVGGGLELAMACDIRLAAEHARFAMPESRRGLGANFGAQMLPRLVPEGVAREMLFLGEPITAREAARWGLVNRVFPSADFVTEVDAYMESLLSRAPLTLRRYKAALRHGRHLSLSAALRLTVTPDPYTSNDRIEGIDAFLEGRQPRWTAT